MKQNILNYLKNLQQQIIAGLESFEPEKRFLQDPWQKEGDLSGEGCTAILEGGEVFERAGVAFSHVLGKSLPPAASAHRQHLVGMPFEAMGVSLVLHPRNPYVPTVHMNVRCFLVSNPKENAAATKNFANNASSNPINENVDEDIQCWFGGGIDLTPYYGFEEDCIHFHQSCYDALAPFSALAQQNNQNNQSDKNYYQQFKKQCDEYFYLKHRQEARGIGGIFFDDFNELGIEQSFAMTQSVGDSFLKAYLPILEKRKDTAYSERERQFQALRRGRYVEFNLVFDRGTLFGLQSGGRTESILMSMPPNCTWAYQVKPNEGSWEERLYTDFLPAQNWLGL